MTGELLLLSYF